MPVEISLMENSSKTKTDIDLVRIGKEDFFRISNSDAMRPFFMSIVSPSNHWMFISSNGGLTAGRKDANYSLFPYYTDDKITESSEHTGSKSIFLVYKKNEIHRWEPFSIRSDGQYETSRNIYKNIHGNKVLFEEINHDLNLVFSYQWNSSDRFGFVKKSSIINTNPHEVRISVLDGIQNILPSAVGCDLQNQSSNLVDAYKRSELIKDAGLGIFALSAVIVDKAEPSEALKANVVWSTGLDNPIHLLSALQLTNFRKGLPVHEEVDIKAEKGSYFLQTDLTLLANMQKGWMIIADVNKNHSNIVNISQTIATEKDIKQLVERDINQGTQRLIELNASADGLQLTADKYRDTRHFSNVLFNIMRGGIFDNNYQIEKKDFASYLLKANHALYLKTNNIINDLVDEFSLFKLKELAHQNDDLNFKRLCLEYMPLKFSRRHGDPSRPWNKFSINTRSEIDGSKILDYEGNWRDIFQNWEALAYAYPEFVESMIHKFLNATTFDGYNPYRITKGGFDWEIIEVDDPWSYIGYWGDHQIIYLLKFLEFIEDYAPGKLKQYFNEDLFVYANVPYKIKSYEAILQNPKDTIEFDRDADADIRKMRDQVGADGALLQDENGGIHHVNFIEKILATILAKLSNFIPEGGIWMNTQRPEWNDANNALVGNGVSMVTLYYLRRFLLFLKRTLNTSNIEGVKVSNELVDFYKRIRTTLENYQDVLSGKISDRQRKIILDELGQAGSDFRQHVYNHGMWGRKRTISFDGLCQFVDIALSFLDHSIKANKRNDNLYHAYNLMTVESTAEISISHLSEMLEGQVAVLSSGFLSSNEVLSLLNSLKASSLFREDQYSYLLYPNKTLPRFFEKNSVAEETISRSALLKLMVQLGDVKIIEKDVKGAFHFNGNFKNAADLNTALDSLQQTEFSELAAKEKELILGIFEEEFNHKAFTGRSGTFYGYEGLGSIYWHMVSKLQLAVMECCIKAIEKNESETQIGKLLEHYYEINEGIGVHKSPSLYGAFPTDPYSHTPAGKGAQQPGMTGQVKEDILCRLGELGVFVIEGTISFNPCLLRKNEFINQPTSFEFIDVHNKKKQINLENNSLAFTLCQVPVVYEISDHDELTIKYSDNDSVDIDSLHLDHSISKEIFERTGRIDQLLVRIEEKTLK